MAKCVLCVHENTRKELEIHPNEISQAAFDRADRRLTNVLKRRLDTTRVCRLHHAQGSAQPKTKTAIEYVKRLRERSYAKTA